MNATKRYAAVTQGEFSTTVFGERSVCCRFFGESREIVCDLSEQRRSTRMPVGTSS